MPGNMRPICGLSTVHLIVLTRHPTGLTRAPTVTTDVFLNPTTNRPNPTPNRPDPSPNRHNRRIRHTAGNAEDHGDLLVDDALRARVQHLGEDHRADPEPLRHPAILEAHRPAGAARPERQTRAYAYTCRA